jgi:EAL domain-containing protein (putative c-di-GMP-specific phosphodiesterase class I)
VETSQTAVWLTGAGCRCAQGFLFSRPLPLDELIERYRQHADAGYVHQQPQTTMEGIRA